jgi:hypothetical protein
MSEPAPPIETQQSAASEKTAAVPTDPAGPSKNALKKKAKEEEKVRKAEERKRKEEEAKIARETADAVVRGHRPQYPGFSPDGLTTGRCTRKLWHSSASPVSGRHFEAPAEETLECLR